MKAASRPLAALFALNLGETLSLGRRTSPEPLNMQSTHICRVCTCASVAATRLAHAQLCPIEDLDHFDEIARICCESSTGAADCSGGFPTVCTRECSMLMEPWWVSYTHRLEAFILWRQSLTPPTALGGWRADL
jgi:hypothetical protein